MGNLSIGIKKFLSNKNTVTIIGVLLIILVVYVGYNWRVRAAINPVPMVYARTTIQPRTRITEDMVGITQVPPGLVRGRIIPNISDVVGRYSNVNTVIPEGSLFFRDTVVSRDELADVAVMDLPRGYVLFNMSVTMASTYGNSIFPGNYIDIQYKGFDENRTLMVGTFIRNVRILAVKDSSGQNVFENSEEARVPAFLLFGVPEDMHLLLRKATFLREFGAELIPIPTNNSLQTNPGRLRLSSPFIADFINAQTVSIPLEDILLNTEDTVRPPMNNREEDEELEEEEEE